MGNTNQKQINTHTNSQFCNTSHCKTHYNSEQFIPSSNLSQQNHQIIDPDIISYYQISDNISGKDQLEMDEMKELIYKYVLEYFCGDSNNGKDKNLIFTKVSNNRLNNRSYSIYYAKLDCMVCTEQRYLIAIVPYDMSINGNQEKLSNLKWISFQTALFSEDPEFKVRRIDKSGDYMIKLNLHAQNYNVNDNEFTKSVIEVESRKDDRTIYVAKKYPILKIELFVSKKGYKNEYADKLTVASALQTFNCTLSFM